MLGPAAGRHFRLRRHIRGRSAARKGGITVAHAIHIHRDQIEWATGVNVLAGALVVGAPLAAGTEGPMVGSNFVAGLLIALLSATVGMALGAAEHTTFSWLIAGLGAWVAVSAAVVGHANLMLVASNLTLGVVIAGLGALCAIAATRPAVDH